MLTVGSLFTGIGGFDLGFVRAGFEIAWMCENEPYAQYVLRNRFPGVTIYDDIRKLTTPPPVDVLIGGFPCQDISVAGKQRGIDDGEESGLWREYVRLIRMLQPEYVVVENVRGLLSPNRRCCKPTVRPAAIGRVLGDLAESGYDAEWQVLSAESVGAPHLRERVFIVAYPRSTGAGMEEYRGGGQGWEYTIVSQPAFLRQDNGAVSAEGIRAGSQDVPHSNGARLAFGEVFGSNTAEELAAFKRSCVTGNGQWTIEPDVGRMADGVPLRVERLTRLGNAVVPQVAEVVAKAVKKHAERRGLI